MVHGSQTCIPLLRRLPRWAWALLVVAILAAIWWLRQPREMRLVGRYPIEGSVNSQYVVTQLSPCSVFQIDQGTFSTSVYDFTGYRRWQVRPNIPQVKGINPHLASYRVASALSFSPDERWQAIIISHKTYHELFSWEEGQLVTRVRIPVAGKPMQVQVLNNGSIYCWETYTSPTPIYLIKGNGILAKGSLSAAGASTDVIDYTITPDGTGCVRAIASGFTYYRVRIKGTMLAFSPAYTASEPPIIRDWSDLPVPNMPYIGAGNTLVTDSGAYYNSRKRQYAETDWRLYYPADYKSNQPVLLQARYYPGTRECKELRILDISTRKAWEIKTRCMHFCAAATPDGRYVLADEDTFLHRVALLPAFIGEHFPKIESWYAERCVASNHRRLLVYERPGRIRAELKLDTEGYKFFDGDAKVRVEFRDMQLSPDGHTVYALAEVTEKGKKRMEVLHFRW